MSTRDVPTRATPIAHIPVRSQTRYVHIADLLTRTDVESHRTSLRHDDKPADGVTCHGHRIRCYADPALCLECMQGWCGIGDNRDHCCCIAPAIAVPEIAVDRHGTPLPLDALTPGERAARQTFRRVFLQRSELRQSCGPDGQWCVDAMCYQCAADVHKGFNGPGFEMNSRGDTLRRSLLPMLSHGMYDGMTEREKVVVLRMARWLLCHPDVEYESPYFATVRNAAADPTADVEVARGRGSGVEYMKEQERQPHPYTHRRPPSFYVGALRRSAARLLPQRPMRIIGSFCTPVAA